MKIKRILQGILEGRGFSGKYTEDAATVFANNSLGGVYSHGVNHFPRMVEYPDKEETNSRATASYESSMGAIERQDGHRGFDPFNAKLAVDRAVESVKGCGVGVMALGNDNHWMHGGSYGWQEVDRGYVGICWSNATPNMSAWNGKDRKIGNNPFIMSIPRSSGKHAVIDYAISQFSYRKIKEAKLKGRRLPAPGGYDTKGNLTTDPVEIGRIRRMLPVGYQKGGGVSTALDLIITTPANGNSVSRTGTFRDEVGLSQVMIVIDPLGSNTPEETNSIVNEILADIRSSEPIREGARVYYPGELELITREGNAKDGIPVIDEIWETLNSLERQKITFKGNIEGRFNSWNISQEY